MDLTPNSMNFIQNQSSGTNGLLNLLMQGAGGMNPYLMGAQALLSGLSGAVDTQQKKDSRWAGGQIRDQYDQLRWNPQKFQGHDINKSMGLFNQGINWDEIMANASRGSGISSPESQAMFGGQQARMRSNNLRDLLSQNVGMQFQDKWNRQNLMSRLSGMMR